MDVKISFSKNDRNLLANAIVIMSKAKHPDYLGTEIIAIADTMRWLSRLQKQIEEEASKPEIKVVEAEPIKKAKK